MSSLKYTWKYQSSSEEIQKSYRPYLGHSKEFQVIITRIVLNYTVWVLVIVLGGVYINPEVLDYIPRVILMYKFSLQLLLTQI